MVWGSPRKKFGNSDHLSLFNIVFCDSQVEIYVENLLRDGLRFRSLQF